MALAIWPLTWIVSARSVRRLAAFWMHGVHTIARIVLGLRYRIEGLQRLPAGPVLLASKHQSAWETMIFHIVQPDVVVGLKYELTRIPFFGRCLLASGCIKIDRGGAAKALRSLVKGAKAARARGETFLIFPEGTRRPVDAPPDYKPGVVALYQALGVPCVPVALNSGLFWGRRSFVKRPGTITLEILEPIPAGLPRQRFMSELESRIEPATRRLVESARA